MRRCPRDLWILLAGLVAGAVNAAAGGGTLLAFPVLIGVGHLSPLAANTTCTVGLLPGIIASTGGNWRELAAALRRDARRQLVPSAVGGVLGAWLLLSLGGQIFARLVPWLLLVMPVWSVTSASKQCPWSMRRVPFDVIREDLSHSLARVRSRRREVVNPQTTSNAAPEAASFSTSRSTARALAAESPGYEDRLRADLHQAVGHAAEKHP